MTITITKSAADQISLISKQSSSFVRLSIESGGCQGFSKVWSLTTDITAEDTVFGQPEFSLLIDNISLDLLDGAKIDYKVDLKGSYFSIEVPSASSTCGCGTSFSL